MPVEVMARRGVDTLRLRPPEARGPEGPQNRQGALCGGAAPEGQRPGNASITLVGFQTHLKWPEQKRVFSMIPALKHAEYLRYGVMHRNTYLDSPAAARTDPTGCAARCQ